MNQVVLDVVDAENEREFDLESFLDSYIDPEDVVIEDAISN